MIKHTRLVLCLIISFFVNFVYADESYYYAGKTKNFNVISQYAEIVKEIDQHTLLIKGEPQKVEQLPQYGIPIKWLNEYEVIIATGGVVKSPEICPASRASANLSALLAMVGDEEDRQIIQAMLNSMSETELQGFIQDLQNFQTRYYTTLQCGQARDYLVGKFQSYGLQVDTIPFTFYNGVNYNVEAVLPGKTVPDKVYIIGAHYDSISNQMLTNAPGADDNASGVAAVLLAAKYLSQYQFNYTIKFVCFAAEEPGLIGSSNYARQQYYSGTQIAAMINMDMIGYWKQGIKYDLNITVNTDSEWLAKFLETVNNYYVGMPIDRIIDNQAWWSDHYPFWGYKFPALAAIEAFDWYSPDFNPYYHSTNDTLDKFDDNLDFALKNAKVCIATLCELADLYQPPSEFALSYQAVVQKGNSYVIGWSTAVNTTLDFYLAKERFSLNRTYIGSADGSVMSFNWSPDNVSPGQYYVCAERRDNTAREWSSGVLNLFSTVYEKHYVYPNPLRLSATNPQLTFAGLTLNTEIKIYNLAGELVAKRYPYNYYKWSWNAVGDEGYEVGSGIYIYVLRDTVTGATARGKFAIIK